MSKLLELTLAIIKPHVVANPVALHDIRRMILAANFQIVRSKRMRLTKRIAADFYHEHQQKFFYNRLITFMTSGPLDVYVLAGDNAIQHWRALMGPTKVFRTQFSDPATIRGMHGLSDTRNASHGSDSPESARKEIEFFFSDFSVKQWYANEEPTFRVNSADLISYNATKFMHELVKIN